MLAHLKDRTHIYVLVNTKHIHAIPFYYYCNYCKAIFLFKMNNCKFLCSGMKHFQFVSWIYFLCTILVRAGTSTANTLIPLLLQQFLLCSLFTWTVTFWLACNKRRMSHFTVQLSQLKVTECAQTGYNSYTNKHCRCITRTLQSKTTAYLYF